MDSSVNINVKLFRFNPFQENSYVCWDKDGDCVIVDPGCYDDRELGVMLEFISSKRLSPNAIWLTHGHFDHIFGVAALSRLFKIPVWMDPQDKLILERDGDYARGVGLKAPDVGFDFKELVDGQTVILNASEESPSFRVIATPGHTPGCVCFYSEAAGVLFSGDTLFAGSIGRTDLEWGDYDKEIVNIMEKLMVLPGDVEVFPGHGHPTSIAEERTTNPFLQPFNEPWENTEDFI